MAGLRVRFLPSYDLHTNMVSAQYLAWAQTVSLDWPQLRNFLSNLPWKNEEKKGTVVGMQIRTSTMQGSMELPQKRKNRSTIWSTGITPVNKNAIKHCTPMMLTCVSMLWIFIVTPVRTVTRSSMAQNSLSACPHPFIKSFWLDLELFSSMLFCKHIFVYITWKYICSLFNIY
jgi:hypothetical protein